MFIQFPPSNGAWQQENHENITTKIPYQITTQPLPSRISAVNILKFPEFVQYKTAILMFHLFHGTLPIHLQNRFTIYSTTRSTRRINTFVMVQARTNIKAMCLSVHGVKLWNSLPNNLRDCNSVIIFKKKLKKYFISIY